MPGPGLSALAASAGARASRAVGAAKGGIFGVAQEAIKGQQAAEAQIRNHKHARNIIGLVHKNAGEGTEIRTRVSSGEHDIDVGYIKGAAPVKEGAGNGAAAGSANPSRDLQGFRHDQPDHVGRAREAAESEPQQGGGTRDLGELKPKTPLAIEWGGSSAAHTANAAAITKGARAAITHIRPAGSPQEGAPTGTRHFVADAKGGTRSVDRTNGSFAQHLDDNEAKYLAERGKKNG